jgi:hypothetical protein
LCNPQEGLSEITIILIPLGRANRLQAFVDTVRTILRDYFDEFLLAGIPISFEGIR